MLKYNWLLRSAYVAAFCIGAAAVIILALIFGEFEDPKPIKFYLFLGYNGGVFAVSVLHLVDRGARALFA